MNLSCPQVELERRMGSAQRAERQKINTVDTLRQVLGQHGILPPQEGAFHLDTSLLTPVQSAQEILRFAEPTA